MQAAYNTPYFEDSAEVKARIQASTNLHSGPLLVEEILLRDKQLDSFLVLLPRFRHRLSFPARGNLNVRCVSVCLGSVLRVMWHASRGRQTYQTPPQQPADCGHDPMRKVGCTRAPMSSDVNSYSLRAQAGSALLAAPGVRMRVNAAKSSMLERFVARDGTWSAGRQASPTRPCWRCPASA